MKRRQQAKLTPRQIQALLLAAEGLSYKAIAAQMGVSVMTIRNHFYFVHRSLNTLNTTHSVVVAWRLGLLDLSGPIPPDPERAVGLVHPVEHL